MKVRLIPGLAFTVACLPAVLIAGRVRPILGGAFFLTAFVALALNGARGTLASIKVRPADADDLGSPVALARVLLKTMRAFMAFLGAMSLVFAVAAFRTDDPSVRALATAFAVAAMAAGPVTEVRRREGLWVAAFAVATGLIVWGLQAGRG